MKKSYLKAAVMICLMMLAFSTSFSAVAGAADTKDAAAYFKGKTIDMVLSTRTGSSVDLVGRTLAPMLGKVIGATIIPRNMGGAGGMEGINYTAKARPNGLVIGMNDSASVIMNQLMKAPGAQWDIRTLRYVANVQPGSQVLYVTPGGRIKTIEDLRKAKSLKFASVSPRGWITSVLSGSIELLGLDAKVITGFKGSSDVAMAVSKGEADGSAVEGYTLQRYDSKGQAKALFAAAARRDPAYPNLPSITEIMDPPPPKDSVASLMAGLRSGKLAFLSPGTPDNLVNYLADETWKIINSAAFKTEFLKMVGTTVWGENESGPEFAKFVTQMATKEDLGKQMLAILEKYRP